MPDYQRIIEDIKSKIEAGVLTPGEKLPSIRIMAGQYSTSQTTVKVALAILRSQGIVRGHQGKGSYVAEAGEAPQEG